MIAVRWAEELQGPKAVPLWLTSLGVLGTALVTYQHFLEWIERRPGAVLEDPVLAVLPVYDLTWPIFVFVYGGLFGGLVALMPWPRALRIAVLAYGLMVVFRTILMAVTPLDPPPRMIILEDPFIAMFGIERAPTRDLFFSGHTATMAVLAFSMPRRSLRVVFGAATVVMGAMVLLQHVHYTVDVLVAPFAAFAAVYLARTGHAFPDRASPSERSARRLGSRNAPSVPLSKRGSPGPPPKKKGGGRAGSRARFSGRG